MTDFPKWPSLILGRAAWNWHGIPSARSDFYRCPWCLDIGCEPTDSDREYCRTHPREWVR
jgi:hypothetical protein